MFSIPSIVAALVLLALAGWLTLVHRRSWEVAQRAGGTEEELRFAARQYRRRMQTSAMIGLVGVAIFVGQFAFLNDPVPWTVYWCGVLLLILWLLLLALADMLDTHQFFARTRREDFAEQVKLQHDLRRQALEDGSAAEE